MSAQSSMNALSGSILNGALAVSAGVKLAGAKSQLGVSSVGLKDTGKDLEMAAKARKQAQTKINAILANKEISQKARTRRVGKVLDEFKKEEGGK